METKLPTHIGIVMDGNGRWAQKRGMPRVFGHKAGIDALERTIRAAHELKIKYISVYAFSTENWKRSPFEVSVLMKFFRFYAKTKLKLLMENDVRVRFAGAPDNVPEAVSKALKEVEEATKENKTMQFIICFNYGGRREILDAFKGMIKDGVSDITEETMRNYLYLPDVPDPDLLIRTSGELRMSNFWLWEGAYSEYYFTDKLWPDFDKEDLKEAIRAYCSRDRRYGGIKNE